MLDSSCSKCDLGPQSTRLRGNICIGSQAETKHYPLLILGQNPSRNAMYKNKVFTDDEGKLFVKTLWESNFPIALSYAIKCFSQEDPTKEQIAACKPYLLEELVKFTPLVVFALGNPTFKLLTGHSGINSFRGQPQELKGEIRETLTRLGYTGNFPKVLASYHPGQVIRIPKTQNLFDEDLTGAIRLCRQIRGEEVAHDATYIDAGWNDIDYSSVLAWDIESTTAQYRSPDFRLHLIGVDDGNGPVKILQGEVNFRKFWDNIRQTESKKVTFNGLGFDDPAMQWLYDSKIFTPGLLDVMPMGYLLDEAMPHHTLDAYAIRWLGVAPWKDRKPRTNENKKAISEYWMRGPQSEEEWVELKQYNARDARYTRDLYFKLWDMLSPELQAVYHRMLAPAIKVLTRTTETGLFLVPENIEPAVKWTSEQMEQARETLNRITADLWLGYDYNPNSPKHTARVLFEPKNFGEIPIKFSPKTQAPSTDAESIKTIRANSNREDVVEFTTALLLHKEAHKMGGFLKTWNQKIESDGRLHPPYFTKTETGRTSSWIHTTPRAPSIRRIIGAPPGRKLIVADLSQIELRVIAWQSRDPEMLATYKEGKNGGDLHTTTAKDILRISRGLPFDAEIEFDKIKNKIERTMAKGVNFGCCYGAEAYTVREYLWKSYGIRVTMDEALTLRNEVFFGRFAGLPPWFDEKIARLKIEKQVVSPIGRIRRLPNISASSEQLRGEAARQTINTDIQSFGSDLALCSFFLVDRDYGHWLEPVMFHHDADLFECDENRAEEAAEIVKRYMEKETLAYMESNFQIHMDVPLVAETSILQEWG